MPSWTSQKSKSAFANAEDIRGPNTALGHKSVTDSSCEASVVAGWDEQTEHSGP